MKKTTLLSITIIILTVIISLTSFACTKKIVTTGDVPNNDTNVENQQPNNDNTQNDTLDINQFYEIVFQSQSLLDILADDIYSNWYDAIYDDFLGGDIDLAIAYAFYTNSENITLIENNDTIIIDLYKKVRDGKFSVEVKDVMKAYSDYYEFIINVSGSFNSFSNSKEPLKKALSSALKSLYFEI